MDKPQCINDECIEGWVWDQMGEFPEPCPFCQANTQDQVIRAGDLSEGCETSGIDDDMRLR